MKAEKEIGFQPQFIVKPLFICAANWIGSFDFLNNLYVFNWISKYLKFVAYHQFPTTIFCIAQVSMCPSKFSITSLLAFDLTPDTRPASEGFLKRTVSVFFPFPHFPVKHPCCCVSKGCHSKLFYKSKIYQCHAFWQNQNARPQFSGNSHFNYKFVEFTGRSQTGIAKAWLRNRQRSCPESRVEG